MFVESFLGSLDVHCRRGRQPELPGSDESEGLGKRWWGEVPIRMRDGWVGRTPGAGRMARAPIDAVKNVMGGE